jgi:hypothetical protein
VSTENPTSILDKQLADLARQIKVQRLVQAFCRLILILVVMVAGLFLLDSLVSFSPVALRLAVGIVLGGLVLGTLFGLLWACRSIDSITVAAKIEKKHPEFGERLLSTVALAANNDPCFGNSQFITLLRQETEDRLAQVDLRRSFASSSNRSLAMLAGIGLLFVLVPGIFWNAYGGFSRRLLGTWEAQSLNRENTVAIPVKLTEEPQVTITPPAYVNPAVHPVQGARGFNDLSVLQYSTIAFRFRFDRPVESGSVELKTENRVVGTNPSQVTADGLTGTFSIPSLEPGSFRMTLILKGKDKAVSKHELPALEIWRDEPPRFTEVLINHVPDASLGHRIWSIPSEDAIPLKVTVEDKVGLDKVELECRINDGPIRIQTLATGLGKIRIDKEILFKPAEEIKNGDSLRIRFKATDNRFLPERNLGPQIVYFPPEGWRQVKIDGGAKPLPEQDILTQRERIHDKVQAIVKTIKEERADLARVREDLDAASPHQSADWDAKVEKLRQKNRAAQQDLHWLALDQDGNEVLHPLAAQAWDIAESELKETAQALDKAGVKTLSAERRDQHLQAADARLARALNRLEELVGNNQRLAEDRLDQLTLEKLAADQELLSGKAGKDLTPRELAELRAGEDRLLEEMQGLTKNSKLVQDSLEAARKEAMQKLDALAKTPEGQTLQKEFAQQLSALGKKQKDLAGKMANLGLPLKDAENAAKAVDLGQMHKAMQFQQETMKKLEHLGKEPPPKKSKNSAKTITQVAKEQKELNLSLKQLASAMADKLEFKIGPNKSDPHQPRNQANAGQAMKQAKKQMDDALIKLKLGKAREARPAMQQAARDLRQAALQTKQHMTRSGQVGVPGTAQNPGRLPPSQGGKAKSGPLVPDLKKYSAEAWGRMPGQLRTRILQDLRAQFGEDYARIIQGYFEKLNDQR